MSRWMRVLVVALFALLGLGVFAAPAQAHATLEGTDPTAGSIVDPGPSVITLNFSENVKPIQDRTQVIAPNGKDVSKGDPTSANGGKRIRIPVRSGLDDGTYLVSYRIISADGHPVSGSYTFSVRAPSQIGAIATTGSGSASVDGVVRGVQSAGRYAAYAGLALLAGPLVVVLGLWPRRLQTRGPKRLAWTGWGLLAGGTAVVLLLQQPYADGGAITDISTGGLGQTIDSTVGRALLARVLLVLAAAPVVARIMRGPNPDRAEPAWSGRVDQVLAVLFGLGILVTFPYAGHAAQSPAPIVSVPAITLHVGAFAIWMGGLAVISRYLLPRARFKELAVIMPVWSRWAFWSVAALVGSGIVETFLEIGGFGGLDRLLNTTYGQLVLTKVIWLGAILVVASNARAWVNRRFGAPVAYAFSADDRSDEPGKAPTSKNKRRKNNNGDASGGSDVE